MYIGGILKEVQMSPYPLSSIVYPGR